MDQGSFSFPHLVLARATDTLYVSRTPEANDNHGVLNLGGGVFDGLSVGNFMGSPSGTYIALNTPSGAGCTCLDLQAAGSSLFRIGPSGALVAASTIQGISFVPTGLTGATAATRYAGATASGAPGSGTFATGDVVVDQSGTVQICTAGGSPGTWSAPGGGGGSGGTKIADSQVGVGGVASVTFSSIPGTYAHLRLIISGRGTAAATSVTIQIQLNGDTGVTNYVWYNANWSGTSPTKVGNSSVGASQINMGSLPAANATANYAANTDIVIPGYDNTTFFKWMQGRDGWFTSATTTTAFEGRSEGVWLSTAAITSIKVFLSSGNFAQGTWLSLYGMA